MKSFTRNTIMIKMGLTAAVLSLSLLPLLTAPTAAFAQAHGRDQNDQNRSQDKNGNWHRDANGKWHQDNGKHNGSDKRNNRDNNRPNQDRYDRDDRDNRDRDNRDRDDRDRNGNGSVDPRYDRNGNGRDDRYENGGYNDGTYRNGGNSSGGYDNGGYNGGGGYGNNGGDYGNGGRNNNGSVTWSGRVDDVVDVYFQGGRSWTRRVSGNDAYNVASRFSRSLPASSNARVSLTKDVGRGTAFVRQQPSRSNNYTAIVRVEDKTKGEDNYRLTLNWGY